MSVNTSDKADHALSSGSPARRRVGIGEFGWIWIALIGIVVLSLIISPGTLNTSSLVNTLPFAAILAIAAIGQTLVIQQRGLDLSVAGTMSLAGVLICQMVADGQSVVVAMGAAIVAGLIAGVLNGLLVSNLSITPLVATLASNALVLGFVQVISGGFPVSSAAGLSDFSRGKILGIPYTIVLAAIFVAVATFVTKKTVVGRRFVAVGASSDTARAAGIVVPVYLIGTYAAAGACFATAGVLLAGFIGTATPAMGVPYLLPSITAVVVGGTPFTGGRGSVIATAAAALFLTQLDVLVLSLGASAAVQFLIQAVVLVVATAVRRIPFRQLAQRTR